MRFCEVCGAAFRSLRTCPRDGVTTRAGVSDPLLGSVLGDRYRILERVAAGGMGQVYRAAHTRIACLFAVKVLYGDLAYETSMQSRFLREAEIASCFSSRYITRVVDFGQSSGGLPYLAMEYLDGSTLFDVVTKEGALPPRRALGIAHKIALGLAHAHERGIVHRDLKTENVIVVREDDEPDIPKLLDFGVARLRESDRLTTAGFVVGTPLYMAPEQFSGEDVDARADLYALGIILYEMLTGVPPFDAPSIQGLADQHKNSAPPSLTELLATKGANPEIEAVVTRLLAKRPADRFASAREVAAAIAAATSTRTDGPVLSQRAPAVAPSVEAPLVALLQAAILEGAPAYNRGDHDGCYTTYRATAERALVDFAGPLAVSCRLRIGLERAAASATPTLAAWELRYAFDDLLFAAPARLGDAADPLLREYAVFAAIAARRDGAQSQAILGDYALSFSRGLAALLRQRGDEPDTAQALEAAIAQGEARGRGLAAVAALQPVLDRIRQRGSTQVSRASSMEVGVAAPTSAARPSFPPLSNAGRSSASPPSGTTDDVVETISRAINVGAPAYNQGRYEVCQRVYRETAEELRQRAAADPSGAAFATWLAEAIRRADEKPARDAAWVFRNAFDAILAARS